MGIAIRRAIEADWASIIALHRRAAAHERALTGFVSDADIAEEQHRFRGDLHVALCGVRLTGFVSWVRNEIAWLYVEPTYFRRGVGASLLRHALEHCGFVAHVRILAGNRPMLDLCASHGFMPVEQEDDEPVGNRPPSVLLRKIGEIGASPAPTMLCRTQA